MYDIFVMESLEKACRGSEAKICAKGPWQFLVKKEEPFFDCVSHSNSNVKNASSSATPNNKHDHLRYICPRIF